MKFMRGSIQRQCPDRRCAITEVKCLRTLTFSQNDANERVQKHGRERLSAGRNASHPVTITSLEPGVLTSSSNVVQAGLII